MITLRGKFSEIFISNDVRFVGYFDSYRISVIDITVDNMSKFNITSESRITNLEIFDIEYVCKHIDDAIDHAIKRLSDL